MKAAVILSTYNAPDWLEKCLWGYVCQDHQEMQVVVADDGSTEETRQRIEAVRLASGLEILHVWHEDHGFQKSAILNKAIVAASADYLIFSDGDCIPRSDFVSTHVELVEPGRFLSGGYFKLPLEASYRIDKEDIVSGRFARPSWLRANGVRSVFRRNRLATRGKVAQLLDALTPTAATWNGHNASGWKADLLRVNGFDERMQYGGQDRELGERLINANVRPKQIRHRAVCFHLDHERPYRTEASLSKNVAIREQTKSEKRTWTEFGIHKGSANPPSDSSIDPRSAATTTA